MKTAEEIAQWVIDNRYPKSELEKLSDHELYYGLVEKIKLLPNALPTKEEIRTEAKGIYKSMMNSGDPEAVRQAKSAQLMFTAGAWYARGFKPVDL